jgi:hypothetical protein
MIKENHGCHLKIKIISRLFSKINIDFQGDMSSMCVPLINSKKSKTMFKLV